MCYIVIALYMYNVFCVYRVAKENRLFAGVWYGSMKPDMSLFLKPLALSLKELFIEGFYIFCVPKFVYVH